MIYSFLVTSPVSRWTRRGLAAVVDQGLYSASSLVTTILLARWLSLEDYGGYALSVAAFQFALQFQNGIVLEPMSVLGPAEHPGELGRYLSGQIRLNAAIVSLLGLGVAGFVLLSDTIHPLGAVRTPLLTLGLCMALLTLPWMVRRLLYIAGSQGKAAVASLAYSGTLIVLLLALQFGTSLSSETAIVAMAAASLTTLVFVPKQVWNGSGHADVRWLRSILSENWRYGRWATLTGLLVAMAVQAQLILSGGILGLEAAGAVRAAQNLIQPMAVSITAISAAVLPSMARDVGGGKRTRLGMKIRWMTSLLTLLAVAYFAFLGVFRVQISVFLYGEPYAPYADLLLIWGLIPIVMATNSGIGAVLKASQRSDLGLVVATAWALVSLGCGFALASSQGIVGASTSALIGYAMATLVTVVLNWAASNSALQASDAAADTGREEGSVRSEGNGN